MQDWSFAMLILVALGWGIRHAFDADHVMTVTGFGQQFSASKPEQSRHFLAFCLHWSIGHGGILLIIGALVLLLGVAIPYQLSNYAETVCALLLLSLGAGLLCSNSPYFLSHHSARRGTLLRLSNAGSQLLQRRPKQSALTIGLLHGLSGSAPLLALLPLMHLHSAWHGMLYLICFGLGVTVGMMLFAASLSYGCRRFISTQKALLRLRWILGVCGMCYGLIMLLELS